MLADAIADARAQTLGNSGRIEHAGLGRWAQCVARDGCAELFQPEAQPAAFEAGMPGKKRTPAAPESLIRHHQTFQGALPRAHKSSSWFLSRNVSIGCQKPLCSKAISWPSAANWHNGSASQGI